MKFNEIIKKVMKETGTTQQQLGDKLGIRQTAVSSMLHRPEPSLATFHEILDILGYEVVVRRKAEPEEMVLTKE